MALLGSLFSSVLILDPDLILNSDLITPSPRNPPSSSFAAASPFCFLLHLSHCAAAPRSPCPFQGPKPEEGGSWSPSSRLSEWGCAPAVTFGQVPSRQVLGATGCRACFQWARLLPTSPLPQAKVGGLWWGSSWLGLNYLKSPCSVWGGRKERLRKGNRTTFSRAPTMCQDCAKSFQVLVSQWLLIRTL